MELTPKSLKKLFKELEVAGWRIEESRSGWKCYSPDGAKIVQVHQTASEYRAGKNILSELKRAGFEYKAA